MDAIEIPREATAQQVLAAIDQWAGAVPKPLRFDGDPERNKLWIVLSALRGPDSDDPYEKDRTTAVIRALSLPQLARHGGAIVASFLTPVVSLDDLSHYGVLSSDMTRKNESFSWHFADHIRRAAEVLLRWQPVEPAVPV